MTIALALLLLAVYMAVPCRATECDATGFPTNNRFTSRSEFETAMDGCTSLEVDITLVFDDRPAATTIVSATSIDLSVGDFLGLFPDLTTMTGTLYVGPTATVSANGGDDTFPNLASVGTLQLYSNEPVNLPALTAVSGPLTMAANGFSAPLLESVTDAVTLDYTKFPDSVIVLPVLGSVASITFESTVTLANTDVGSNPTGGAFTATSVDTRVGVVFKNTDATDVLDASGILNGLITDAFVISTPSGVGSRLPGIMIEVASWSHPDGGTVSISAATLTTTAGMTFPDASVVSLSISSDSSLVNVDTLLSAIVPNMNGMYIRAPSNFVPAFLASITMMQSLHLSCLAEDQNIASSAVINVDLLEISGCFDISLPGISAFKVGHYPHRRGTVTIGPMTNAVTATKVEYSNNLIESTHVVTNLISNNGDCSEVDLQVFHLFGQVGPPSMDVISTECRPSIKIWALVLTESIRIFGQLPVSLELTGNSGLVYLFVESQGTPETLTISGNTKLCCADLAGLGLTPGDGNGCTEECSCPTGTFGPSCDETCPCNDVDCLEDGTRDTFGGCPIGITSEPAAEGASATVDIAFGLALSVDCAMTVATTDGTAVAVDDFEQPVASLTASAGQESASLTVQLVDDDVYEGNTDETFTVDVTFGAGCDNEGDVESVTMTILDDDDIPAVEVVDATLDVDEDAGTVDVDIVLSNPSFEDCEFTATTSGVSATSDTDFSAVSETVMIAAGDTSVTVQVSITDDAVVEATETLTVTVTSTSGCTGTDATTISIIDNEPVPEATLSGAATVDEGDVDITLTLTLGSVSTVDCIVSLAVSGGSAEADADFTALAVDASVTIAAGETVDTFTVSALDDALHEGVSAETIEVSGTAVSGCTLGVDESAVVIGITDGDAAPVLSITSADVTVSEASGTVGIDMELDAPSGMACTIAVATLDDGATGGDDFTAIDNTVTIAAGATQGTFTVTLLDDSAWENLGESESFSVQVTGVTGCSGSDTMTITLEEDDPSFSNILVRNSGSTTGVSESSAVPSAAIGTLIETRSDGGDVQKTFVVENTDEFGSDWTLNSVSSSSDLVAVQVSGTLPLTLAPGDRVNVALTLPGSFDTGVLNSNLVVDSSATRETVTVAVRLVYVESPSVSVAFAPSMPLASVNVAAGGRSQFAITLTNTGAVDLDLDTGGEGVAVLSRLSGSGASMFTISDVPRTTTVAAGESVTWAMVYAPSAAGTHAAQLVLATNVLSSERLVIPVQGSATEAGIAKLTIGGEETRTLDAGSVPFGDGVFETPLVVSNAGGEAITIDEIAVTNNLVLSSDLQSTEIAAGDSVSATVRLDLVSGESTSGTVTVTIDGSEFVIEVRASGVLAPDVVVYVDDKRAGQGSVAMPMSISGVSASTVPLAIVNSGGLGTTLEDIVVEPTGTDAGDFALIASSTSMELAPSSTWRGVLTFVPRSDMGSGEATARVRISRTDSSETMLVDVSAAFDSLSWTVPDETTVFPRGVVSFTISLPAPVDAATSLVLVSGTASRDTDFTVETTIDGLTAVVSISVLGKAQTGKTIGLGLIAPGSPLVELTIVPLPVTADSFIPPASDSSQSVLLSASGLHPGSILTQEEKAALTGSVVVAIPPSAVSAPGRVVLTIVEDATEAYADPDINIGVTERSALRPGGVSFAIELEGGIVLTDDIEVTVSYDCDADSSTLTLLLFDTALSPPQWVPADSLCEDGEPRVPLLDDAECTATVSICHLTQFVLAQVVVSNDDDDAVPAAVTDAGTTGASASSDDDFPALWLVSGCLALVVIVSIVVGLVRRRRTEEKRGDVDVDVERTEGVSDEAVASSSSISLSASSAASSGIMSSSLSSSSSSFSSAESV